MYSSHHTLRLIGYARQAYASGVRLERQYGFGINNRAFQRAFNLLTDVIVENDVAMSPNTWNQVEGLMAGDLNDVKEAFYILGQYAQMAVNQATHVERGGYVRGIR